jgi:hypothetical protein
MTLARIPAAPVDFRRAHEALVRATKLADVVRIRDSAEAVRVVCVKARAGGGAEPGRRNSAPGGTKGRTPPRTPRAQRRRPPVKKPGPSWAEFSGDAADARSTALDRGRDFFTWTAPVSWIVSNPPWSQFRAALDHALTLADHVVYLVTVNHWWTRARVRSVRDAGFGYRDLLLIETPDTFKATGFAIGAMHVERGYRGSLAIRAL